jgi:glycosyltransferase involved in cell wall biosynthesis
MSGPSVVVFDEGAFVDSFLGGMARGCVQLATELARAGQPTALMLPRSAERHFFPEGREKPADLHLRVIPDWLLFWPRVLRAVRLLHLFLAGRRFNGTAPIYHATGLPLEAKAGSLGYRIVYTVHDMAPEIFGAEKKRWSGRAPTIKNRALKYAQGIIFVSEKTRRDFRHFFPWWHGPTKIVHHGVAHVPLVSSHREEGRILWVGNRTGYKNAELLFKALQLLVKEGRLLSGKLVLVGGAPPSFREQQILQAIAPAVSCSHINPSEKELQEEYEKARVLVYTSTLEGFGFPPLEALVRGCPVICGAGSGVDEIYGDAVISVDPHDPAFLARQLGVVLRSEEDGAARRRKAEELAELFPMGKTAQEALAFYREIPAPGSGV